MSTSTTGYVVTIECKRCGEGARFDRLEPIESLNGWMEHHEKDKHSGTYSPVIQ